GGRREPVSKLGLQLVDQAPAYAPTGAATIAVSAPVIAEGLVDELQTQLRDWFPAAADWEVLRVDEVHQALPVHQPGHNPFGALQTDEGIWVCGDHRTDPSINGAVASGRAVAAAVVADRA
ncbi:MAG: FAD-dependent oxidoreductase, partial [Actinomycetota bacterium]